MTMDRRKRTTGTLMALALVTAMIGGACGDDNGTTEPPLDFEQLQGLYGVLTLTFDPQGSAPAADVLAVLEAAGQSPSLNIGRTGGFQLFFRDPVSGNIRTLEGQVEGAGDQVDLVFATQADADLFLFPRRLSLTHDAEAGTLAFSGQAAVSRMRLLQLFPDLYAEEQLFDPTPGTLTVGFGKTGEE
jgi:hypothetical protein